MREKVRNASVPVAHHHRTYICCATSQAVANAAGLRQESVQLVPSVSEDGSSIVFDITARFTNATAAAAFADKLNKAPGTVFLSNPVLAVSDAQHTSNCII